MRKLSRFILKAGSYLVVGLIGVYIGQNARDDNQLDAVATGPSVVSEATPAPADEPAIETSTAEDRATHPEPESPAPLETKQIVEKQPAPTEKAMWVTHEFKIIRNKDISVARRIRLQVFIVAPTAVTPEDRIATLMAAAIGIWKEHAPDFIGLFMLTHESGDAIARIDYAPDKCGVSGDDCSGEIWTNAHASDGVLTLEQVEISKAWYANREEFMKTGEYGKTVDEPRLKEFLAKKFDITVDRLTSQLRESIIISVSQKEMEIPERVEREFVISDKDKEKAEIATCSKRLQCWGDKHNLAATFACQPLIEELAKYDYEWTDGWLGAKLERFRWQDRKAGTLSYTGNKIKFQNGFGAWQRVTYWCHYDPAAGNATVSIHE